MGPGVMSKLSWNMAPEKWSEVEAASDLTDDILMATHTTEYLYGLNWTGPHEKTEAAVNKLEKVQKSGVATIYDSDNGHGGGTIVFGSKIYGWLAVSNTTLSFV